MNAHESTALSPSGSAAISTELYDARSEKALSEKALSNKVLSDKARPQQAQPDKAPPDKAQPHAAESPRQTRFALVDCNNFYASCETLFRPDLRHKPIVVLSNNDGCIVARNKIAKAIGIKMGVPYFKVKALLQQHQAAVFSSNYALYADISRRVMQTLDSMCPQVEVYSIDEAFLDLATLTEADWTGYGHQVRQRVMQHTGIQVCVGIAPTKTLAKLANYAAKQYPATGGVVDLSSPQRRDKLLAITPVAEVWGVGRQLERALQQLGITTAAQLAAAPSDWIRQRFSVVLERTAAELRGVSCLALQQEPPPRQQIVASRSFGERITCIDAMQQAITLYISRAAEKLRQQQLQAGMLQVFIRTSSFASMPYYSNSASMMLPQASADTRVLLAYAITLLSRIWRDGYQYAKAGVMLADLTPQHVQQLQLALEADRVAEPSVDYVSNPATARTEASHAKGGERGDGGHGSRDIHADLHRSERLMQVMDSLNQRQRGQLFFASQGMDPDWQMKRQLLSPAYTTSWQQLPYVGS